MKWLPTFLPKSCGFQIHSYQGKHAFLRKLKARLRGYATWLTPEHCVVVVVDRDGENCKNLKSRLEEICDRAGLRSKSASVGHDWQVVTRIAIEEVEAWYFGDWRAVTRAYPRVSANVPRKRAYRNPDSIAGGTWEAFERVMKKHGYYVNGLSKVKAANKIGQHMDPTANSSQSFVCFRDAKCQALRCVQSP